jgi:hypothetical protein
VGDGVVTIRELILDINNICRTPMTNSAKIEAILRLCDIYEDKLKK